LIATWSEDLSDKRGPARELQFSQKDVLDDNNIHTGSRFSLLPTPYPTPPSYFGIKLTKSNTTCEDKSKPYRKNASHTLPGLFPIHPNPANRHHPYGNVFALPNFQTTPKLSRQKGRTSPQLCCFCSLSSSHPTRCQWQNNARGQYSEKGRTHQTRQLEQERGRKGNAEIEEIGCCVGLWKCGTRTSRGHSRSC